MNLLIKKRGKNKTTGLIYTSEATRYPIVCSSKIQTRYIKEMAEKLECDIPEPLTVEELRYRALPPKSNVLFDNLETIIEKAVNVYLDANVVCATMTDYRCDDTEKDDDDIENEAEQKQSDKESEDKYEDRPSETEI